MLLSLSLGLGARPHSVLTAPAPLALSAAASALPACQSMTSTATDDWCQNTCLGSKVQAPGCASLCCCESSCKPKVDEQRKLDRMTKFVGKNGQCHFAHCSKEICPADKCVSGEWNSDCKGPRPVVFLNDGQHSGSRIITSALANFTGSFLDRGAGQQWPEVLGSNEAKSKELQSPVKFMAQFFCNARRMDPNGTLAGFKFNTFGHRYVDSTAFDEVWQELAQNKVPILHVLRSDMSSLISTAKHDAAAAMSKAIPNATVKIPIHASTLPDARPTLQERLEHLDKGRAWLESKYTNMGATVKVSSFELLLHSHAQTRMNEWRRILLFYGAKEASENLTLKQLDAFLEGYKQRTKAHDERPYDEVVTNWKEIEDELNNMKRSFRVSLATRATPLLAPKPIDTQAEAKQAEQQGKGQKDVHHTGDAGGHKEKAQMQAHQQEKHRQEKQKVELRQKQQKAKEEQKGKEPKVDVHHSGDAGGHKEKAQKQAHQQEKVRQEKHQVELRQKQQKGKEEQKASPGKHHTGDAGGHEEKAERDKHHKEALEMDKQLQLDVKPQPVEKQKVELRDKQPKEKKHVDKAGMHHSGDAGGHEDQAERDKHHKEENAKKEKKKHKSFDDREDQKILAVPHHSSPPGKAVALEADAKTDAKPDTRLPMAKAKAAKAAANLKAANLMAKTAKMSAKVAEDVRRLKSASAKRKP